MNKDDTGYSQFNQFDIGGIFLYKDELIAEEDMTDIKNMVTEINIFEDAILNPSMSAILIVVDAFNLIDRIPILGGEKIRILYNTVSDEEKQLDFVIYKIGSRQKPSDNTGAQTYSLYLCTQDRFNDAHMNISRAFQGPYETIVQQHLLELNTNKDYEHSQSVGVHDWITPFWTPLRTCRFLADEAYTGSGSPFLFFETITGYKFKSLSDLYADEPLTRLYIEPRNFKEHQEDADKSLNSVLFWETGNSLDRLRMLNVRATGSYFQLIDYNTANITQHMFNYASAFDRDLVAHLEPHKIPDASQTPISLMATVTAARQPHIYDLNKNAAKCMMDAMKMTVVIPGNSRLEAGKVIELDVPTFAADTAGMSEQVTSGKWFIASLRHTIRLDDYTCTLELVKDSISEEVVSIIK